MEQNRLGSASSTVSSPRSSTSSVISPPSLGSLPSPPLENERTYAFAPIKAGPVDLDAQLKAFSFGTCPSYPSSAFVGTPTAELGPFEYPVHVISPPPTRRSSTCSTISTVPAAGRRPSVIHSSTAPPDTLPVVPDEDESAVIPPRRRSSAQHRRPSIMFRHQGPITPGPIPPSLRNFNLDRRGSLPISSLFPQPPPLHTTTTTELYARRNSSISSAGTGESSRTATANATRRGSLAVSTPAPPPQSYFTLRRQSVPHNLHSSLPYNPSSPRRISSPRASISLQERRALRSSVSASNPFVSSGSEDDSVEEEPELALGVEERPPLASHGSDGSTPTGSTDTTVTIAVLQEREREGEKKE